MSFFGIGNPHDPLDFLSSTFYSKRNSNLKSTVNTITLSMENTISVCTTYEELQQFNNGCIVVGNIAYKIEPDFNLKPIEHVIHRHEFERYTYVFKHGLTEAFKINTIGYNFIKQDPKTSQFSHILVKQSDKLELSKPDAAVANKSISVKEQSIV